ncbi:MAG TPA: TonB-dependent receptor [Steroidobacteraceae bacterium]|nr:TonB-dependent receptor [Steroidobacteraceae bacterium]
MSSLSKALLRHAVAATLGAAAFSAASAQDATPGTGSSPTAMERLTVVGSREQAFEIGGAANYVSTEDIRAFKHTDVMRVLRQVPGVYLVEEEGFGLRPNIGIRGSGTDRNARITVMEDGVLIAPAPYAAPAAYYFPTMARMSAVEIRKGSASVRSGPRTTGGAMNLISTPIPGEGLNGYGNVMFGEDETLLGHGYVGGTSGNWGFLLEGVRQETDGFKRLDGGGSTGYELDDYLAKLRYTTNGMAGPYQEFELKLGRTEQDSDETYMGLTDDDFGTTPYRRYAASQLDNIATEHEQYELRHFIQLGPTLDVTTAVYRNDFARNWYKVEQVGGQSLSNILEDPLQFADQYGWLTGVTSPDDAITIRNNNREYESQGIQTILAWSPASDGAIGHSFEFGLRYHEDEEDRFQDNDQYRMQDGQLVLTTDGAPGSQTNRVSSAEAFSAYVQDDIRFGDWIVTPGVRYERIELERLDYSTSDPDRSDGPTRVRRSTVDQVMPGIGAVYQLNGGWSMLASAHKGFNPPAPGSTSDAEESVNYEAGVRYANADATLELIGFFNDYENLVGTCTASTGGNCDIGDQFDAGEVRMRGVELAATYEWDLAGGLAVPLQLSYTYTDAEFRNSFSSDFEEWGDVTAGDSLPYLPPSLLRIGTGLAADRWSLNLSAAYVDAMRVVAGQGPAPASESTDEHWVVDLSGEFAVTQNFSVFARVENLLDETYIAARRPAGVRPGRPQTVLAGLTVRF